MGGQWVPRTAEGSMIEQTMALVKLHGLTVEKSCLKNPVTGFMWAPITKCFWVNGIMRSEPTWMWVNPPLNVSLHTAPLAEALAEWVERGYPTS